MLSWKNAGKIITLSPGRYDIYFVYLILLYAQNILLKDKVANRWNRSEQDTKQTGVIVLPDGIFTNAQRQCASNVRGKLTNSLTNQAQIEIDGNKKELS